MRLTTKGRYAVTAMLDLALHRNQGPVSLADIAARQSISQSYLEQLFSKLKKCALVKSVRGPGGGYELCLAAKDIAVVDIIDAVDEKVDATQCQGKGNCHDGVVCITHHLWSELNEEINRFLGSVSLETLMSRQHKHKDAHKNNDRQAETLAMLNVK